MKKTLSITALSTVLVLGMAAGALADHLQTPAETAVSSAGAAKLTIDGAIRHRGMIDKSNSSKDTPANSSYNSRARLGVKAKADHVTGYLQLETGAGTNDNYNWGTGSAAGLHVGGYKTPGTMTLLQSWVQYQPGDWGVKVGHMPLALGNKVFFDHTGSGDDAIMAYKAMGDTHVAGILIKFDEQNTKDSTDDLDGYVALATHKFSDNLDAGINWTYLKGAAKTGDNASPYILAAATAGMSMSNVGMNANYRQDNLSFLADLELQFGDVSDNGTTKVDAGGWALKLAANMDLGTAKVGLLYGYGSGDDGTDATSNDNFLTFVTDTNYDTLIANYRATTPGSFVKYSGLSNLSEYQINVATKTICPMTGKQLSIKASATYLQVNEEAAATAGGYLGTDSDIGTELDAIASWSLAPGLVYKVEAAYMFVGDAWNTATTGNGANPDDLYFLRHRIEYSF